MPRSSTPRPPRSKPYDAVTPPRKPALAKEEDTSLNLSDDDIEDKPYIKDDPDTPTKPKAKRKSQGVSPSKAPGRNWTGAELVILFETALTRGAKKVNFEGVIEDRTALQCFKTWQNTAVPFIKRALMEKGEGKR